VNWNTVGVNEVELSRNFQAAMTSVRYLTAVSK